MMTPLESRILDINSDALGVSIDELMDNAGKALADVIEKRYSGKKVLIVCGRGNNGGDGLAVARHLRGKVTVAMLFDGDMRSDAAAKRLKMIRRTIRFGDIDVNAYDVIVDCVLGAGTGRIDDVVIDYILKVNTFTGSVISTDIPTGFGNEYAVVPDITVTFHDIKEGMTEENCGEIIIADIGVPAGAVDVGPGDMLRYPIPDADSHKGQNGRLLIVGGGPYIGAPALACMASQRVGVDLVTIATPKRSFVQISSMSPSFITFELSSDVLVPEDVPDIIRLTQSSDALLIGPGLGLDERTVSAVIEIIGKCNIPVIVDADAIAAVSRSDLRGLLITPHRRELDLLMDRCGAVSAEECAEKMDSVIISKGRIDLITDGKRTKKNRTGCAAMTSGGTGDALAGIIAGLVSKGMAPFHAGCLGAYICGRAGEIAFAERSYGMTVEDLIDNIPEVFKEHFG